MNNKSKDESKRLVSTEINNIARQFSLYLSSLNINFDKLSSDTDISNEQFTDLFLNIQLKEYQADIASKNIILSVKKLLQQVHQLKLQYLLHTLPQQ